MSDNLTLYTDGGARGNPGPAGTGFAVFSGAGNLLEKCGNFIGTATNNQAEYQALIDGLRWIVEHHSGPSVLIYMDSLLIVNQLSGKFKVKTPSLLPLFQQARALLSALGSYRLQHIPREKNSLADSLVNQAVDQALYS